MTKILFVPLDERPCNYMYPKRIVEVRNDIELLSPDINILGKKKLAADINKIWQYVEDNISGCSAFVFSTEMMFYGGLLPSRLHHYEKDFHASYISRLKALKKNNPNCKFYNFQLIMRTPRYSSNDEEPDYYGDYGREIFLRAYLMDKQKREGLSEKEKEELTKIKAFIPTEIIRDYEYRREYNLKLNQTMIELVKEGIIDFLSIPQDDSCEYGYTAMDQAKVVNMIRKNRLQQKVMMYPGADEAGSSLVARAISDIDKTSTKVYPFYASELGPQIIPLYEDRIMIESLKSHLMVANCEIVTDKNEADFILAINCPGKFMQESFEDQKDITYSSYRNLNWFCHTLKKDIDQGYKVIVADCAFANGGDLEFIQILDDYEVLDKIYSYKAWNTHCNTLGTSIAQMVVSNHSDISEDKIKENIIYHLLEDTFYQAVLRKQINQELKPPLNYFDLCDKQKQVSAIENQKLRELFNENIQHCFKNYEINCIDVYHPWNRMFEIGINLCVSSVVI